MSLIQSRAHRRHLGVCEHRVPARLFVLNPVAYALTMLCAHCRRNVIGKMAQPLAQRHHPITTVSTAVPAIGTSCLDLTGQAKWALTGDTCAIGSPRSTTSRSGWARVRGA